MFYPSMTKDIKTYYNFSKGWGNSTDTHEVTSEKESITLDKKNYCKTIELKSFYNFIPLSIDLKYTNYPVHESHLFSRY